MSNKVNISLSFKTNLNLKRITEKALSNKDAVNNLQEVISRLSQGIEPILIGNRRINLGDNFYYLEKYYSGIVVYNDLANKTVDIVAFALLSDFDDLSQVLNSEFNLKLK